MMYEEYANLFLEKSNIPCKSHMAGQSHGMAFGIFMVDYPWGYGYTVGNASQFTPTLLQAGYSNIGGWSAPRVAMTGNYEFFLSEITGVSDSVLHRINKITLVEDTYNPRDYREAISGWCNNFTVYDDNTVFTVEDCSNLNDDLTYCQLCKITFNNDGTANREVIYQESFYYYTEDDSLLQHYNGYAYEGDIMCIDIMYINYQGIEKIIIMQNWYDYGRLVGEDWIDYPEDGAANDWLLKVWIYDINSNSTDSQWIVPAPDDGISRDLWEGYLQYGTVTPAQYQNKYIITFDISNYSLDTDEPINIAKYDTIIIDILDNSINQIYNLKYSNWNYDAIQWGGGVIDYDTGIYYFEAFQESYDYGTPNGCDGIIAIDFNSDFPQQYQYAKANRDGSYGFAYFQGKNKAYGVNLLHDRDVTPDTVNIYDISTMTIIDNITIYYANGSWFESIVYLDRDNNRLWTFTPTGLEGTSLIGEEKKYIPILWEDGTIPYAYGIPVSGDTPKVNFRALDGSILAMVTSWSEYKPEGPSGPNWHFQLDFYLLSEYAPASGEIIQRLSFETEATNFSGEYTTSNGDSVFTINWGDNSPQTSSYPNLQHTYSDSSTKTITLTTSKPSLITNFNISNTTSTGTFPRYFERWTSLEYFDISNNSFTRGIPDFTNCWELLYFDCHNNQFDEYSIGSNFNGFSTVRGGAKNLRYFNCSNNLLSGQVPDLSSCTLLEEYYAENNMFSEYMYGTFRTQPYLKTINLYNNRVQPNPIISSYDINMLLDDCMDSLALPGRVTCYLNISGPLMQTPSATGYAKANTLRSAGWTVITN